MPERDTDRASLLCERIYGLLLAAYPRRFRDAYEEQSFGRETSSRR
jgi:hypothetical protein